MYTVFRFDMSACVFQEKEQFLSRTTWCGGLSTDDDRYKRPGDREADL